MQSFYCITHPPKDARGEEDAEEEDEEFEDGAFLPAETGGRSDSPFSFVPFIFIVLFPIFYA